MTALWRVSLRQLRARPGRALLTVLSIVISVAAVVAVNLAITTTRLAHQQMFQALAGRADLEVTAAAGGVFEQSLARQIEQLPAVRVAVPSVHRTTVLYVAGQRLKVQVLGVDPQLDQAVRDYRLQAGQMFDGEQGIVVSQDLARNLHVGIGTPVKLLTRRGLWKTRVTGLVAPSNGAAYSQGAMVYLPLKAAQRRFAGRGQIDSCQILLQDDAKAATVQAAIAAFLPEGLRVHPPAARSQMAQETFVATQQAMRLSRDFSLMAAAFIILNAFLMNVGERRRQYGILRAIGATQAQIARMLYREAALIGLLGAAIGIAVGILAARYLTTAIGGLFGTELPGIQLTVLPFVLAATFGLGVSLVGVFIPVQRARRLSPSEALQSALPDDAEAGSRRVTLLGAVVMLIAGGVVTGSLTGWLPTDFSVWGSVSLLIGLVLVLPAAVGPLTRVAAWACRPWAPVESSLARRQLMRHRMRTTLTMGVLFVATSTGIGLASAVLDNVRDVKDWYHRSLVGDFFVRAMAPDMATGAAADLPEQLHDELKRIPHITTLDSVRLMNARAAEQAVVLVVRQFVRDDEIHFDLPELNAPQLRQQLAAGQVVIGSVLSQRTGLKQGEYLPLETREGTTRLPIAAVANEYLGGGLAVYIQRDVAQRLFHVSGTDAYIVKANHAHLGDVERALREVCQREGLLLHSFADMARMIDRMIAGVVASLWVLVVLGFAVSAFGVVNTLTMNVLEQTRELGLLRVVAMTRSQVRKTIFAQAVMLGLMGLLPGMLSGAAVAYLINLSTLTVTGHAVEFDLHPWLMLASFIVGMTIILIAAWGPAERAARLELSRTLQYE